MHGTFSASTWQFVAGYSPNVASQSVYLDTSPNTNSASRYITELSIAQLGLGPRGAFDGRMAEVVVAHGFSTSDITTIRTALAGGARPIDIPELAPYLDAYQPLRKGLNDVGYVGPSFTNNGVTFDEEDHPPVRYRAPRVIHQARQRR